ncbi:MAG TPA: hypothetical protein VJA21_00450, partial [Verrucomicrobiae bacterium]
MKSSPQRDRSLVSLLSVGLTSVGILLLLGASTPRLVGQSVDFNSGSLSAGWVPYALPAYGAPTFSFVADDTGGQAFKVYAPPTGTDPGGMGNARAGYFRSDVTYTGRFSTGIDLLGWNALWRHPGRAHRAGHSLSPPRSPRPPL